MFYSSGSICVRSSFASARESFSVPNVVSACSSEAMLTNPDGQSFSKTLNADFTCAGVYEVLTFLDITVTNSVKHNIGRSEDRGPMIIHTDASHSLSGRTVKINLPIAVDIDLVNHRIEFFLPTKGCERSEPCAWNTTKLLSKNYFTPPRVSGAKPN